MCQKKLVEVGLKSLWGQSNISISASQILAWARVNISMGASQYASEVSVCASQVSVSIPAFGYFEVVDPSVSKHLVQPLSGLSGDRQKMERQCLYMG